LVATWHVKSSVIPIDGVDLVALAAADAGATAASKPVVQRKTAYEMVATVEDV